MSSLKNVLWILRFTSSTQPRLLLGIAVTTATRSLFPAALALISRGLINALAEDGGETRIVLLWLVAGLGVTVVEALGSNLNAYLRRRLTDELNIQVSLDIMQHAAQLDLPFFETAASQDVLERLRGKATAQISQFVMNLLELLMNGVQLISLFAILLVIEPLLGLLMLPILLPFGWFHWYLARKGYTIEVNRTAKRRWAKYFVWISTDYRWIAEVKLLALPPLLTEKMRELLYNFRSEDRYLYRLNFFGNGAYALFATAAFYIVFVRLALRVLAGSATIGDVAIYGGATVRLRTSLQNIFNGLSTLREQQLYVADLREFLQTKPAQQETAVQQMPSSGDLVFHNVSFTYPNGVRPALSNLSVRIKSGETVALVGENGAGKSTLVKLIAQLYRPTAGKILYGSVDLADVSVQDWQQKISFVFQDFSRYEATAAENIAYGDWTEVTSNEAVAEIARLANVDSLIEAMPQGYDTPLGRRFADYTLSEGQWQQLAIARAFARRDSQIFILDEPTASLDPRAEYKLFQRLRQLAAGRTTILTSHRFSTVRLADRILVLEEGQVVEDGSHNALMARGGQYATLYNLQRPGDRQDTVLYGKEHDSRATD